MAGTPQCIKTDGFRPYVPDNIWNVPLFFIEVLLISTIENIPAHVRMTSFLEFAIANKRLCVHSGEKAGPALQLCPLIYIKIGQKSNKSRTNITT